MNNEENTNNISAPDFEGEKMKMPENTDMQEMPAEEEPSVINGPLLFFLAVLLVLILGGLYYWFGTLDKRQPDIPAVTPAPSERPTPEQNNEPETPTAEAQTSTLLTTSSSDEISAIEADVEATNLDDLDAELKIIDAELESAL